MKAPSAPHAVQSIALVAPAGTCALGELWHAKSQDDQGLLAIRMPQTADATRVRENIDAVAARQQGFAHPGVLAVRGWADTELGLVAICEAPESASLASKPLKQVADYDALLRTLSPVLDAFVYAHSYRQFHGAIEPSLVFHRQSGALCIAGFGLADALLDAGAKVRVSGPTCAPESAEGLHEASARGDLYALGAIATAQLSQSTPALEGSTETGNLSLSGATEQQLAALHSLVGGAFRRPRTASHARLALIPRRGRSASPVTAQPNVAPAAPLASVVRSYDAPKTDSLATAPTAVTAAVAAASVTAKLDAAARVAATPIATKPMVTKPNASPLVAAFEKSSGPAASVEDLLASITQPVAALEPTTELDLSAPTQVSLSATTAVDLAPAAANQDLERTLDVSGPAGAGESLVLSESEYKYAPPSVRARATVAKSAVITASATPPTTNKPTEHSPRNGVASTASTVGNPAQPNDRAPAAASVAASRGVAHGKVAVHELSSESSLESPKKSWKWLGLAAIGLGAVSLAVVLGGEGGPVDNAIDNADAAIIDADSRLLATTSSWVPNPDGDPEAATEMDPSTPASATPDARIQPVHIQPVPIQPVPNTGLPPNPNNGYVPPMNPTLPPPPAVGPGVQHLPGAQQNGQFQPGVTTPPQLPYVQPPSVQPPHNVQTPYGQLPSTFPPTYPSNPSVTHPPTAPPYQVPSYQPPTPGTAPNNGYPTTRAVPGGF